MSKTYVLYEEYEEASKILGVFDELHKKEAYELSELGDEYRVKVFEQNVPSVAKGTCVWLAATITGEPSHEKILLTSVSEISAFDKSDIYELKQIVDLPDSTKKKWVDDNTGIKCVPQDAEIAAAKMVFWAHDYISSLTPEDYQHLITKLMHRKYINDITQNALKGLIDQSLKNLEKMRVNPQVYMEAFRKHHGLDIPKPPHFEGESEHPKS